VLNGDFLEIRGGLLRGEYTYWLWGSSRRLFGPNIDHGLIFRA